MQSLMLIAAVLFGFFALHSGARFYGFTYTYAEKRSEVFGSITELWALAFHGDDYAKSIQFLNEHCRDQDCYLDLPTYQGADSKLYLLRHANQLFQHLQSSDATTTEDPIRLQPEILSLQNFLRDYPRARGVLHINANRPGVLDEFLPHLEQGDRYKAWVLCSQFGNILRSLRERKPHWNTCASRDEVVRANMMSSIYLESISPLPSDYFYIDADLMSRLSPLLFAELRRRHIFTIGPKQGTLTPRILIREI